MELDMLGGVRYDKIKYLNYRRKFRIGAAEPQGFGPRRSQNRIYFPCEDGE